MARKKPIDDLDVLNEPACRFLLSKGMYVTGRQNPPAEDAEVGDGHCWCSKTQHAIGPDDDFVDRHLCTKSRTCYVPVL